MTQFGNVSDVSIITRTAVHVHVHVQYELHEFRCNCVCLLLVASEDQVDEAKIFIERYLMSHIYRQAMFPNGDGDIARDQ